MKFAAKCPPHFGRVKAKFFKMLRFFNCDPISQLDIGARLPSYACRQVAYSIFFFRSSIPERCLGEMLYGIEKTSSESTEMFRVF
jgi:hypothetical protein